MVNTGTEEPAQIVTKLRQALDAIGRLSSERAALEEALKVEAHCLLTPPLDLGSPSCCADADAPLNSPTGLLRALAVFLEL